MNTIDKNFFPGWTRKSITFSIDDGNLQWDEKFLSIVAPAGFHGTFNLISSSMQSMTAAAYRSFYRGHEIANHCKFHPALMQMDRVYSVESCPFDKQTADPTKIYPTEVQGCYMAKDGIWLHITTPTAYRRLELEGYRELEAVFGVGHIRDFVWPFGRQKDVALHSYLIGRGYRSIRQTGETAGKDGFCMPSDRFAWSYTATHENLLALGREYEASCDNGALRFFCIGVHSIDFERAGRWEELRSFCRLYGNRPEDYYYAPVGTLFAYEDALSKLVVREHALINPTEVDLYILVNARRVILRAHSYIELS